jgi:hypothetical protein
LKIRHLRPLRSVGILYRGTRPSYPGFHDSTRAENLKYFSCI